MPTLIDRAKVEITVLADAGIVVPAALSDQGAVAVAELNNLAVVVATALERRSAVAVAVLHDGGRVAGIRARRRSEREDGGRNEEDGAKHGVVTFRSSRT